MGRTTAAAPALAALALAAGCADPVEAAEVCASHADPPIRAEQQVCDARTPGYGAYSWPIPDHSTSVVIVDVGQPLPRPGTPGAGAFGPARASSPARVFRPPPKASSPGGSTISRGGIGVSGVGSSSGS
jgi:hypothetical protein